MAASGRRGILISAHSLRPECGQHPPFWPVYPMLYCDIPPFSVHLKCRCVDKSGSGEQIGKQLTAAQEAHVAALDPRYLETEVAINGHTAMYQACNEAFRSIIRKTRGRFDEAADSLDPLDVRFTRTVAAITAMLPGAGLLASDWTDLLEFYEIGERNAARLRHIYDWFVAHPDVLTVAAEAGLFDDEDPMRQSDRVEAEITGLVRRFWRSCSESVRRRGYPQFLALGMPGAGVSLYTEEGGSNPREVEAYRPSQERRSA